MPALPIPSEETWPHVRDVVTVWSHLCYPADEEQRRHMMSAGDRAVLLSTISEGIAPMDLISGDSENSRHKEMMQTLNLPHDVEESMADGAIKASRNGQICSWILKYLYSAAQSHPQLATLNCAYRCAVAVAEKLEFEVRSGPLIRTAWSSHKSVAHLWAALLGWKAQSDDNDWFCPGTPEGLPSFLAIAEAYRHFGEAHLLSYPGGPAPALPPQIAWGVPSEIELPEIEIGAGGLSQWAVEQAKNMSIVIR